MKKFLAVMFALSVMFSLASCGNTGADTETTAADTTVAESAETAETTETAQADTIGSAYLNAFKSTDKTTAADVAAELITVDAAGTELVTMDVNPGYLNGFDDEIKGFSKATMFSPMIGPIPFIGYVFETDEPDALLASLDASANLRWLVCTEADEKVSDISGNLVFFLMCSNETYEMQ